MGDPYIKLMSLIDPDEASADFHKIRGGAAKTNITYNVSNNTSAEPASTSVTLSTEVAKTLDKIGKYFPAMLGVMALNALVLIALVVLGVVFLCRRRQVRVPKRTTRGRLSPMPTNSRNSYIAGVLPPQPHAYQPVSMAFTEDTMFTPPPIHSIEGSALQPESRPKSMQPQTYQPVSMALSDDTMLVPPSPGFRNFEGSTLRPGDRPRSMQPQTYEPVGVVLSDDTMLLPPSPGFHNSRDRPKSVA